MKIGIVRPYNAYGPRDHFGNDSHVIPDLIRRVIAGEDPLLVWGSGKQTRSFLYVQDLAEGMIAAIEKYPVPDPVNLGSDEEVSVKDLVNMIMEISGSKAKVIYDKTKPDGSPRRKSDNTKAKKLLEFRAKTSLQEGLDNTIKWYLSNIK
jgi:nucleoside-diphosphate-sugar epimerase